MNNLGKIVGSLELLGRYFKISFPYLYVEVTCKHLVCRLLSIMKSNPVVLYSNNRFCYLAKQMLAGVY